MHRTGEVLGCWRRSVCHYLKNHFHRCHDDSYTDQSFSYSIEDDVQVTAMVMRNLTPAIKSVADMEPIIASS